MAHDAWLPQMVLLVALIAAFVRAIRGQMFVPIAAGPEERGPMILPADSDDEEGKDEPLAAPPRRGFSLAMLPAAVLLTAAVRVAFLVALRR